MSKKAAQNEIDAIVNDARESFDLGDFLRGRSVRTKTVRVFTDEVTAEERGGYEQYEETLSSGLTVPRVRSWGLVASLADVQEQLEKLDSKTTKQARELKAKAATIEAEIEALTAKLIESSLVLELKSVPKVIKKDAYRAAKQTLGIHGKVREERISEVLEEQSAQMLVRTVVSITRELDGAVNKGVTIEGARSLIDQLPDSEWDKIDETLKKLLVERTIADQVVADADF